MKEPKNSLILVVDDEEDLREAIAFDFRRRGYQVVVAASGNDAFRIVESSSVDVVISDVRMANGDGVELLDRIKARNPYLPAVIFITGFADISLLEAYDRGAEAVFAKPFNRKALFEAVDRALHSFEERYQRSENRVDVELAAGIKFPSSGIQLQTSVTNLGRGGIFVVLPPDRLPETGEAAEFSLSTKEEPIIEVVGRGVIRWVRKKEQDQSPLGCGIEFEWLTPESISQVVELINATMTKSYIPQR